MEAKNCSLVDFSISQPTLVFSVVYLVVVAVIGSCANAFVMFTIVYVPSLHNSFYFLMWCLSLVDFITSFVCVPFFILTMIAGQWPPSLNYVGCKFLAMLRLACTGASVVVLGMISINRFVKISKPAQVYQKFSKPLPVALLMAGHAVIVVVPLLGPVYGTGAIGYNEAFRLCSAVYCDYKAWLYQVLLSSLSVAYTLLSFVSTSYLILRKLHQSSRRVQNHSGDKDHGTSNNRLILSQSELKTTKMLLLLLLMFLVCWIPLMITVCLDGNFDLPLEALRITDLIFWANSAINPFLYASMNKNFMQCAKRIFKCHHAEV
ncbi:trace amine-associated receptor 6-like [Anneissia japonica]|uniref:trace amine-associated receptor 6-like n=1 Tax=Anneissia japonica TaxID=1529436 RepID=UPI001425828D|nr:trace amine-associated receptor 6-like [Anneissia japonica]